MIVDLYCHVSRATILSGKALGFQMVLETFAGVPGRGVRRCSDNASWRLSKGRLTSSDWIVTDMCDGFLANYDVFLTNVRRFSKGIRIISDQYSPVCDGFLSGIRSVYD